MAFIRPMPARDGSETHRAATQLELFFDLVSVIAIAALAESYHHAVSAGHGIEMFVNFAFCFMAIWWAWMNYTWFASAFDNDDGLFRLLTIVIMAGLLLFAAGISHIFETLDLGIAVLGWSVMRVAQAGLWIRVKQTDPSRKDQALRHIIGLFVAQSIWIAIMLFVTPGGALFYAACGLAFAIELATPIWGTWSTRLPWHKHHIIERYGLLNIIVLGEALLSVSLMFGQLYSGKGGAELILTGLSGLIITFSLWWLYFLEEDHLNGQGHRRVFVWGYGHILVYLGAALLAVGLGAQMDVLSHHSEIDMAHAGFITNAAAALYLAGLWLVRDRYHALGPRGAALPVMALVILAAGLWGGQAWLTALFLLLTLAWRLQFGAKSTA